MGDIHPKGSIDLDFVDNTVRSVSFELAELFDSLTLNEKLSYDEDHSNPRVLSLPEF